MAELTHSSTHPPLPPTTEEERLNWLRLLRSRRVGPATFWRLLAEHGSAGAALSALPGIARAAGVQDYAAYPLAGAQAEVAAARAAGARSLCAGDRHYPAVLRDLPDAPPFLWTMGDVTLLSRPLLALVGARSASSLGERMARRLAEDLAGAGHVVVSGLARGIDAAAHRAAVKGGTIAVLAGGVNVDYPPENRDLAADLRRGGLVMSEQPMDLEPQARHFPARNRIIAALARAVVVVEAAARSGSLITARAALDLGREVMAVPGHPIDARAAGCNQLIRDGATLVRDAADVLAALQPLVAPHTPAPAPIAPLRPEQPVQPAPSLRQVAALHRQILDRLGPSPLAEDQLIRDLAAPAQTVAPALLDLEMEGRIERQPGGLLARLH